MGKAKLLGSGGGKPKNSIIEEYYAQAEEVNANSFVSFIGTLKDASTPTTQLAYDTYNSSIGPSLDAFAIDENRAVVYYGINNTTLYLSVLQISETGVTQLSKIDISFQTGASSLGRESAATVQLIKVSSNRFLVLLINTDAFRAYYSISYWAVNDDNTISCKAGYPSSNGLWEKNTTDSTEISCILTLMNSNTFVLMSAGTMTARIGKIASDTKLEWASEPISLGITGNTANICRMSDNEAAICSITDISQTETKIQVAKITISGSTITVNYASDVSKADEQAFFVYTSQRCVGSLGIEIYKAGDNLVDVVFYARNSTENNTYTGYPQMYIVLKRIKLNSNDAALLSDIKLHDCDPTLGQTKGTFNEGLRITKEGDMCYLLFCHSKTAYNCILSYKVTDGNLSRLSKAMDFKYLHCTQTEHAVYKCALAILSTASLFSIATCRPYSSPSSTKISVAATSLPMNKIGPYSFVDGIAGISKSKATTTTKGKVQLAGEVM